MKFSWANLLFLSLGMFFLSACQQPAPIIQEASPWTLSNIPPGNWLNSVVRYDCWLGVISQEEYLEVGHNDMIEKRIPLPKSTMADPRPILNQNFLAFVGKDSSQTDLSQYFIKLQSTALPTNFIRLKVSDLIPKGEAFLPFGGPMGALNEQNQLLLYFDLYQRGEFQFFLFDITIEFSGLSLALVKSFTLPGNADYGAETRRLSSVSNHFLWQSMAPDGTAQVYQINPKGEAKVILRGEALGFFSLKDTIFAHMGGPYLYFSIDETTSWQPYSQSKLGPIVPYLSGEDTLLYQTLHEPGLYYSADLKTGHKINSLGLPDGEPKFGSFVYYEYYLLIGDRFYRHTSLSE